MNLQNVQITPNELNLNKTLRVKYGIDPTGSYVHLGHTVPLLLLKQFQDAGHQAVIIIGDYTALVGDPSGRDKTRTSLTPEQIKSNATDYIEQISKIINIYKTEIHFNSEWFSKMSFSDILSLTSKTTVQRILERDDFANRLKDQTPVYMHELLYPLMQGWDSVQIKADVEIGGTEQLFNLMMGRNLQISEGQTPQICMTLPILRGCDGKLRMGKSLNNFIGINESSDEQFAKTMSIPDSIMDEWFTLLFSKNEKQFIDKDPMAAKKLLGLEIVKTYHGPITALVACKNWEDRFSKKQIPTDLDVVTVDGDLVKILIDVGFVKSKGAAKNLIQHGAVSCDSVKITDPKFVPPSGTVLKVGPRRIVKLLKG